MTRKLRPRPVYVIRRDADGRAIEGVWSWRAEDIPRLLESQMKAYGGAQRSRRSDWRDALFADAQASLAARTTKRGKPRQRPPGRAALLAAVLKGLASDDPRRDDVSENDARDYLERQRTPR
jgi:hypothetical protein